MKNLIALLQKQKQQLDSLILLLESELHLISTRDAESLTSVINEKSELLESIASTDKSVEQEVEKQPEATSEQAVTDLFDQINQSLSQCKFRTEINQKAVEQGQLRLQHLRTLLLESRAKETMTYDKSGKPKGGSSGKSVTV
ncbi:MULTISPECIES: flagellar export chaperone FlgN [Alteromonadaceae]|uniref:flagellar export chaperone FlgN n=1 Tax=Alteromonadaceae TaxID=72275 RepID=UPI001C099180|nr:MULTISPECIES: flagellar export chaperone FlgN [Aliiglaciecola]MBU2877960.1 flagellar protein FlgN [Aliiglaciecola lipolytica]MDO6709325.1 flagellar export chaperone FlgN [Aliiglaciecola sp. 2_MG-2023]MDO6750473.1 flagellar export chaperone FlgN [Aliiglaciecola sp. 1_MG-2023]